MERDLVESGRDIEVTLENRDRFVALKTRFLLTRLVEAQMESIRSGFNDLILASALGDFTAGEIEQLICGVAEIDVEKWRSNTVHVNFTAALENIGWFWSVVEEMTNAERVKVFQFVTGTTKR